MWGWNFIQPVELASEHLDAICKAFYYLTSFFLSLQML